MYGPRGRYLPLLAMLETLPADQPSVRLSFAEITTLIGGPLPPSAYRGEYWKRGRVAVLNWQHHGFTARLDHDGPAVTFIRQPQYG